MKAAENDLIYAQLISQYVVVLKKYQDVSELNKEIILVTRNKTESLLHIYLYVRN